VADGGADTDHSRFRKATYHSWEPQAAPRTALPDAGPPIPPWTPPVVEPPNVHPLGTTPTAKPTPTPKMDPVALTMKESETVIVTAPRRLTVPAMDTSEKLYEPALRLQEVTLGTVNVVVNEQTAIPGGPGREGQRQDSPGCGLTHACSRACEGRERERVRRLGGGVRRHSRDR
jgi:hypothetical protein